MPPPFWWPQIVTAADRRRHVTGLLLAHATVALDDGVLRLQFTDPAIAAAWRDSGAQVALEAALTASGIAVAVEALVERPLVSGA
jgi:hypothetical protein